MGKGGGGSAPAPAPTSSTVTQTNLPEYVEPFFTRLLERTEAESNAPYVPFEQQRLAEFGPDTLAGFQGIRDIAGSPAPAEFGTASGALSGVAGQAPLEQQAQFGAVGVPRREYLEMLASAMEVDCSFHDKMASEAGAEG